MNLLGIKATKNCNRCKFLKLFDYHRGHTFMICKKHRILMFAKESSGKGCPQFKKGKRK